MNAATMAQVPAPSPAPNSARAIVIDIALNVALPYGSYALLHDIGQSESRALIGSALIPTAVAIASIVQRRRMNALSLLVIGATVLSLGATVLSGSAWFALVRPSFITGAIAIVFALSLLARRPTLFYLARDTMCATAEAAAEFETHWDRAGFRRSMRRLTIVWAAFLAGEALLRLAIAAIWPNPAVIAATQIAWIILPVLLVRWSIRAGRRWGQE